MLKQLEFDNFRCFAVHKVPLRPLTIIVGRNNAGKSTVAEGLRLISLVLSRYWNSTYRDIPRWLDMSQESSAELALHSEATNSISKRLFTDTADHRPRYAPPSRMESQLPHTWDLMTRSTGLFSTNGKVPNREGRHLGF